MEKLSFEIEYNGGSTSAAATSCHKRLLVVEAKARNAYIYAQSLSIRSNR